MVSLTLVAGVCPLPAPTYGACYADCPRCPRTQFAWSMDHGLPVQGMNPKVLVAVGGCRWSSDCYRGCPRCPAGTARVWYVQVPQCDLVYRSAALVPVGPCRWSSCCPKVGKDYL